MRRLIKESELQEKENRGIVAKGEGALNSSIELRLTNLTFPIFIESIRAEETDR
jgi:hypothetical protein